MYIYSLGPCLPWRRQTSGQGQETWRHQARASAGRLHLWRRAKLPLAEKCDLIGARSRPVNQDSIRCYLFFGTVPPRMSRQAWRHGLGLPRSRCNSDCGREHVSDVTYLLHCKHETNLRSKIIVGTRSHTCWWFGGFYNFKIILYFYIFYIFNHLID